MKQAWRLAFDFQARWAPCPKTLADWEACDEDMIATLRGGGNAPLLRALLVAVWNEFERVSDASE